MKTRTTAKVVYAPKHNMGDLAVRQPLPSAQVNYLDPFVLLHHADIVIDTDRELKFEGVGPHPHKGFSPVTFVFKGGTHHRDSRGNDSKIYAGGTQWMNAGMGIIHGERPLEHEMEIIQMWVNSPAKNKNDQPAYYPLTKEQTPQFISEDKKIEVNVVTGNLLGVKGGIPTLSPINSAMITAGTGGKLFIPLPAGHNTFLYLLNGKMNVGETTEVPGLHMVVFNNDGDGILIEALENTRALLMSGEPIGEKIEAHGPFVMNNATEIMEAYRDYKMGKMGVLIEE